MQRSILSVTTCAASYFLMAAGSVSAQSAAQQFPARTLRMITSEAGSSNDVASRMITAEISGPLHQAVIVENRPSSLIGSILARATPDGYTMALTSGVLWPGSLTQKTDFDPFKDLQPITTVMTYP